MKMFDFYEGIRFILSLHQFYGTRGCTSSRVNVMWNTWERESFPPLADFIWTVFESSYSQFCRKYRAEVYVEVTMNGIVVDEEINESRAFCLVQRRPSQPSEAKELKNASIPLGMYVCATNSLHHSSFVIHIDLLWKFKRPLNTWMSAGCHCRWCFQFSSVIYSYLCAHLASRSIFTLDWSGITCWINFPVQSQLIDGKKSMMSTVGTWCAVSA